ncbi:MAG: type II secretion system protein GspM, partial [Bacillota bacterium]
MWQRLNRREQVLLGILGAILVLYIYWSYVFTPLYQNFEDTRHELKMVSQRLRKGEDVANARQRWEAAVREAEE